MAARLIKLRDIVVDNVDFILHLANLAISDSSKVPDFKGRYDVLVTEQATFRATQLDLEIALETKDSKQSRKLLKSQTEVKQTFNNSITAIKRIHYELTLNTDDNNLTKLDINSKPHSSNTKLPKLSIPTFTGKINEWSNFSDLFNSLVHSNSSLTEIEKYEYLKLNLRGEALALIKHIRVDSASYASAWEIIQKRYNVKRTIVEYHVQQILFLPSCVSRNYKNVTKLVNVLRENIAALKVLSLPIKEWSFLLLTIVKEKLDSQTRSRYEDLVKDCEPQALPEFDQFLKFLESELIMLQAMDNSGNNTFRPKTFNKSTDKPRTSLYDKPKFIPKQSSSHLVEKATTACPLCTSNHPLTQCLQFLNKRPFERWTLLKNSDWCLRCLALHKGKLCQSSQTCPTCHQNHHGLLHFSKTTPVSKPREVTKKSDDEPPVEGEHSYQTIVHNSMVDKFTVVLPTAIVFVKNGSDEFVPVRCLLDTGSQSSYITKDCAYRLKLKFNPFKTEVFGLGKTQLPNMQTQLVIWLRQLW